MTYAWKRFWYPRAVLPRLTDDGFLTDPEEFGGVANPDVCTLTDLARHPCVALLGEAGAGKSMTLEAAAPALRAALEAEGNELLLVDLRAVGSEASFDRDLWEDPALHRWRAGAHVLHLVLDGFDECLLHVPVLVARLLRALASAPRERARLWIACRGGEWPPSLEDGLRKLWGDANVGVYQLAPLRKRDVTEAAQAYGVDGRRFLNDVISADAVALALRPVTLRFILNHYQRDGRLVLSRVDLYRDGCRKLCDESQQRKDAGVPGKFTAGEKLAVAQRVAAVLVLGGRTGVIDAGETPDSDLVPIDTLVGGCERFANGEVAASAQAILETLRSALFSSRGPNRFGFAHQTYAEFLAASYLLEHGLDADQIMLLLTHPEDTGHLVPQLHEVAAWLASMSGDVFRRVVDMDAEVLLRSDTSTTTPEQRKTLVANLLGLAADERLPWDKSDVLRYQRLTHPDLEEQLRTVLRDRAVPPPARELAIDIGRACSVRGLAIDLADIAADAAEPMSFRESAGYAVVTLAVPEASVRLKPLLQLATKEDPDDQLKGYALRACWPTHLTTGELLAALTPAHAESFFGSYAIFLLKPPVVPVADLPEALEWIRTLPRPRGAEAASRHGFVVATLAQAFKNLDVSGIEAPFLACLDARKRRYEPLLLESELGAAIEATPAHRRRLAAALVARLRDVEDAKDLLRARPRLLRGNDLEWLIDDLRAATGERQEALAALVAGSADLAEPLQRDLLFEAKDGIPVLAERLVWAFGPIDLDSDCARSMRESYAESQRIPMDPPARRELPFPEVVELLLSASEAGRPEAFARLAFELIRGVGADRDTMISPSTDLSTVPAWKELSREAHARVVTAAQQFLETWDPAVPSWLGTATTPGDVLAGYQALVLLHRHSPEQLEALPAEVWRAWGPVAVGISMDDDWPADTLIKLAYEKARAEVVDAVRVVLKRGIGGPGGDWLLARLEPLWGTEVADLIRETARNPEADKAALGVLMPFLLTVDGGTESEVVASLIRDRSSASDPRAVMAAARLVTHGKSNWYPVLWPEIQRDRAFGREVLCEIASGLHRPYVAPGASHLSEAEAADVFLWLTEEFPYAEDPKHKGAYRPEVRDHLRGLRDSFIVNLRTRGTRVSCAALERICRVVPEARYSLLEAEVRTRAETWVRPAVADILALAASPTKRLVRSGRELRDVLLQALRRVQARLQGETPEADLLWNEQADGRFRPRKENLLSDYVKNRLQDEIAGRGIVVNREVEIRKGLGAGEETDIHVSAVARKGDTEELGTITLIIETKGCWHPELLTAIENQLVLRYLRENACREGIYLVVWFDPGPWDPADDRRRRVSGKSLRSVREELQGRAKRLSNGDVNVALAVLDASLRPRA